jgi:SAM-dependent methyltransferase
MAPFAAALNAAAAGLPAPLRFHRADGSTHEVDASLYLHPFALMLAERPLCEWLCARVAPAAHLLDLGCGAGRHARWLAARGYRIDAVDASAEVASVARRLGTPARVDSAWTLPAAGWDGVLLLGNSIGLCGTAERLPELLGRLLAAAPVVALDSVDYGVGRGEVRVRIEYRGQIGEWFDWLHPARQELVAAARTLGAELELLSAADGSYGALLRRGGG